MLSSKKHLPSETGLDFIKPPVAWCRPACCLFFNIASYSVSVAATAAPQNMPVSNDCDVQMTLIILLLQRLAHSLA